MSQYAVAVLSVEIVLSHVGPHQHDPVIDVTLISDPATLCDLYLCKFYMQ